jgi:N-acetylmuramoyl-L-alanine amidase
MKIEFIFVHHTAVSYSKNPDQWGATNEYHKKTFNMVSSLGFYVGYNYEISRDGVVRKAREEGEETAAVKGYNKNSVSICLDGDFDNEDPTDAQKTALSKLLKEVKERHSIPIENIRPHRAVANKTCYGKRLKDDWAQNLVRGVEQYQLAKFTTAELIAELQRRVDAKEL